MSFLFSKRVDALKNAEATRTYGVFYEETVQQSQDFTLHNCCEISLILSDGNVCLADDKLLNVGCGDMLIFNQFEPHLITHRKELPFASFGAFIHPEYIKARSSCASDLSLCFFNKISNKITLKDDDIKKLEELFVAFRKNIGFGDDIAKNSAIDYFLVLLNKHYDRYTEPYITSNTASQIVEFISSHISEDLNLDIISRNFSISVNQLCKIFKEELNTTVSKYISAKRISMAKKLLSNKKSVAETAQLCGFSDYANFIRVFKKLTGTPPGKYKSL